MYGLGLLKGLSVTLKRFVDSYLEDFRWITTRYDKTAFRTSKNSRGTFTIEYPFTTGHPKDKIELPIPENFRYKPFLLYEEGADGAKEPRCTSCGICAKVCPTQCIWIVRTIDPVTKRPLPQPAEFTIDADICMSCGFCAEYCPFDAIKMDHDFEVGSYTRNLMDKEELLKPVSYYAKIRPNYYAAEEKARAEKAAAKAAKPA
jgi:NADH-quinone oxidoreductase subunit I